MIASIAVFCVWLSFALVVYTYAGYPLLLWLLSRCFPKPRRDLSYEPTLTMLIAAYNEERDIVQKIRDTLALDYPADKLDIVVVSDGSSDRTDELLASVAKSAGGRLKYYRQERGGKTVALNLGGRHCTGDIIVFSDVTSRYEPQAIREMVSYYIDPLVGVVTGICRFHSPHSKRTGPGIGQILYGGYEQSIRVFQCRIQTATAAAGPIYSIRRSLFTPLDRDACFDMMEPLAIVRQGYRVICAPEANAHEFATRSSAQEFRMRVRVSAHGFAGLLSAVDLISGACGPWVALQIVSHKLLRYLLPIFLLLLFLSSLALVPAFGWAQYLFLCQAAVYGAALLAIWLPGLQRFKLFSLPLYFCIGNAAALLSIFDMVRGNKHVTWNTERA